MKGTMYLGSMDHTPSEQLGDPQLWHTTVLALSEGGEHWELAADIARQIMCRNDTLKKWSGRRRRGYKQDFERALKERIAAYPVHVRAISAQGKTIMACLDHMLQELSLGERVRQCNRNGKSYLEFGPFQNIAFDASTAAKLKMRSTPVNFLVAERQGIPLVFMAHFLLRMHRHVLALIQNDRPELDWIDWQLMPNKFPGDIEGPMAKLFHAIMSGAAHARLVMGNIRVVTLVDSRADHGSRLCDNLAGLLSQSLKSNEISLDEPQPYGLGASFLGNLGSTVTDGSQTDVVRHDFFLLHLPLMS